MPVTINFSADLEPVPFKRAQFNGKWRFNDPRYSDFKNQLGWFARQAMHGQAALSGAIKFTLHVFKNIIPTALSFGDLDNHAKAVFDALNGICYKDDRQIIEAHIYLHKGTPHIEIELEEINVNAILNAILMVVAVHWFADALCSSDFAYFFKGFCVCCLIMKFFDDIP